MINVLEAPFSADPTGQTSSWLALQNAVDAAASKSETVLLPAGKYWLTQTLRIPKGVRLLGEFFGMNSHRTNLVLNGAFPEPCLGYGTTILTDVDFGDGAGMIVCNEMTGIKGIAFYDPKQNPGQEPKPRPPVIFGNGDHCVIGCEFVNSYIGAQGYGRPYYENITGQPLHVGIDLDGCGDNAYLNRISFDLSWSKGTTAEDYCLRVGTSFKFGWIDGLYCNDLFSFRYNTGILCYKSLANLSKQGPNGIISGGGFDSCLKSIHVKSVSWDMKFCNMNIPTDRGEAMVIVESNTPHRVIFDNVTMSVFAPTTTNQIGYAKVLSGLAHFNRCYFSGNSTKPHIEKIGGIVYVNDIQKA